MHIHGYMQAFFVREGGRWGGGGFLEKEVVLCVLLKYPVLGPVLELVYL